MKGKKGHNEEKGMGCPERDGACVPVLPWLNLLELFHSLPAESDKREPHPYPPGIRPTHPSSSGWPHLILPEVTEAAPMAACP